MSDLEAVLIQVKNLSLPKNRSGVKSRHRTLSPTRKEKRTCALVGPVRRNVASATRRKRTQTLIANERMIYHYTGLCIKIGVWGVSFRLERPVGDDVNLRSRWGEGIPL
jgi:hypothetical protein